jgi:hypothetical protein
MAEQEAYRVKDFLGYTKLLVYTHKYNPDGVDAEGKPGCYEECISIKSVGWQP